MLVTYTLNNYTVGAKLRTAPLECLVSKVKVDRYHTDVVFKLSTQKQKDFCDKLFAKQGKILE